MNITSPQSGMNLLRDTVVGSLLPDHPSGGIICFSKTDPLATVFQGLAEHQILSAPVYDPVHRSHNAFVDMVDIVSFLVNEFSEQEITDLQALKSFKYAKCGNVADLSGRDPYLPVEAMAPLLTAITKMVKWRVHRIPVIDSEGELQTVITQSHIVKFLYQNMYMFGTLPIQTVGDLKMFHAPVITISTEKKGFEAFKTMHDHRVSAVAVVDNDGKLIGNISVSDLKTIGFDGAKLARLYYPVSQFLKLLAKDRSDMVWAEEPICVSAQSQFREVVGKLVQSRIHRVYLADASGAPTGVITQHEVLAALLKFLCIVP